MKKLLLLTAFIICAISSFAQFPNNQSTSNPNTLFHYQGGLTSDRGLVNTRFPDTLTANTFPIAGVAGGQIIVGDTVYIRNITVNQWIPIGTFSNNRDTLFALRPLAFDSIRRTATVIKFLTPNGVVSGGTVTVDSCRSLDVMPGIISLNYVQYTSVETHLTVPASDPTFARVDEVIDSLGYIVLRTGTPSATPIGMPINSATEWILASYTFAAGASCVSITQIIVWDQNVGSPNEFVLSTSGTISANGNNTDAPYHLTKAIFVNTYASGSSLIFTNSSPLTASPTELFKFWVYLNGTFGSNQFQIQFYLASAPVGNPIAFGVGYGFNPNDSGNYQNVNIPFSAFNLTNQTFDKIIITFSGSDLSGAKGLYLDYLQLQSGVTNNSSQLIVTHTGADCSLATYDLITGILNIPPCSGGSGGRFGIEDNTGIQDRYNSFQGFSFIIDSIDRFSINEVNGVNKGFFDMDSTRTRMLNQNDTAEALILTGIDPGNDNTALVDLQTTLVEDGITYLQEMAMNPKFTRFLGTVNGEQRSKVVFEHTDTLLTPPTYVYVTDADTLKLYPFPAGGGGTVTGVTATTPIVSSGGTAPVISMTNQGTATTVLHGNAAGNPSFGAVGLTTDVSGTLPIANGGTNNGSLSVTAGTLYYGDGTKLIGLAPGTSSQYLIGGTTPAWTAIGTSGWTLLGNSITPATNFVGTTNNTSLLFKSNNTLRSVIDSLGYYGWRGYPNTDGIANDSAHLFEFINDSTNQQVLRFSTYGTGQFMDDHWYRARGRKGTPTGVKSGDFGYSLGIRYYDGTVWGQSAGAIQNLTTQDHTTSAHGNKWVFSTTPNNSITRATALTLDNDQSATFTGAIVGNTTLGITGAATLSSTLGVTGLITATGGVSVPAGSSNVTTPSLTILSGGSITTPRIYGGGGTTSALQITSTANAGGTTGSDIYFNTGNNGGTETMRILNNGNVGIGEPAPGNKLTIVGATNGSIISSIKNSTVGTAAMGQMQVFADAGAMSLQALSSGFSTSGLSIANSGRITTSSGMSGGLVITTNSTTPSPIIFGITGTEYARFVGSNGHVLINTTTDNSTLTVNGSFAPAYIAKTANYTATISDYTIDCTSGTFTVTLPTAVGISGRIYVVKNTGTGSITVATTSSQTIDGVTTQTLATQYSSYTVQSNNVGWIIL